MNTSPVQNSHEKRILRLLIPVVIFWQVLFGKLPCVLFTDGNRVGITVALSDYKYMRHPFSNRKSDSPGLNQVTPAQLSEHPNCVQSARFPGGRQNILEKNNKA